MKEVEEKLETNISVAAVTIISAPLLLKETRFPFQGSEGVRYTRGNQSSRPDITHGGR